MRLSLPEFLVIGLLLLPACHATLPLIHEKNTFTGETIIRTPGNELPRKGLVGKLYLDVRYIQPEVRDSRYEYWVTVRYPRHCIKIPPGKSLFLVVDGKEKKYSSNEGGVPNQSYTQPPEPLACLEYAVYQAIPRADIEEIVHANSVDVKLVSRTGPMTASLSKQNVAAIEAVLAASIAK